MTTRIRNVNTDGLRFRLVDAKGEVLGRLASHICTILQGKDKPTFQRDKDAGDVVVVVNAAEVTMTGRKLENKVYIRHTGYPGGIRETRARDLMQTRPTEVLRLAVERMLPRNLLRDDRMRKLRLFAGPEHPGFDAAALVPLDMPPRRVRNKSGLPPSFELPEGVQPANPAAWEQFKKMRGSFKGGDLPAGALTVARAVKGAAANEPLRDM